MLQSALFYIRVAEQLYSLTDFIKSMRNDEMFILWTKLKASPKKNRNMIQYEVKNVSSAIMRQKKTRLLQSEETSLKWKPCLEYHIMCNLNSKKMYLAKGSIFGEFSFKITLYNYYKKQYFRTVLIYSNITMMT